MMDAGILQSIKMMRAALFEHYDLTEKAKRRSEEVFVRIEELGLHCNNRTEFETKFAASSLKHEYTDLFIEFTAYVRAYTENTEAQSLQEDTEKNMEAIQPSPPENAIYNKLKRNVFAIFEYFKSTLNHLLKRKRKIR